MAMFPGPRKNDADDVSLALEVAQSQWARGDAVEALKWLKKAVDAAFDAGDDARGVELTKVAAELKSQHARPAPPPQASRKPVSPTNHPSVPPPRGHARSDSRKATDKPIPPHKPASPSGTMTRRSSESSGKKSVSYKKPSLDEEEATREFRLEDEEFQMPAAAVADEWPTETLDGLEEEALERTGARRGRGSEARKKQKKEVVVPSTRAIRVAVGSDRGRVYVRLLDSTGLREGEHDAMLVALTRDGDIRMLFK
ncbi:MAG TPA: hypothetical protein PLJ27_00220 [Polyangiaceae bacterium]|nr:hypothetical protein [Polyangiaceae bacterium]HNZ20656.1 hypothetical protein [Polyangiaceae bacterium]HOD20728.1 hypothetical protein [Polyangiaceae bacterium]HOE47148.1 hypothetical protein [Polyangiaceae bacterium]HOG99186.1 hypothetical protein [Polyangiaceae bacterium]